MPTSINGSTSSEDYPCPANTIEGMIMRSNKDPEYMKPFWAAYNGDTKEVQRLVDKNKVNEFFYHPDDGFKTALHCASEMGHYEAVKALLLIEGVRVDYRDGEGMTPLLRAAFSPNNNTLSIIELLIIGKAERNAVDDLGNNALHIAINKGGGSELISGLVGLGVNVDKFNNDDETPLHFAISQRNPELVRALLDGGANPLLVDKEGKTYLHHLADFRGEHHDDIKEIIIMLREKGVDIDAVDKKGMSASQIALENNNTNFADALKALESLNSQSTNEDSSHKKVEEWLAKITIAAERAGTQNSSNPDTSEEAVSQKSKEEDTSSNTHPKQQISPTFYQDLLKSRTLSSGGRK